MMYIMRRFFLAILCYLSLNVGAMALEASVSYATFKSDKSPYVELYFYILANSVAHVPYESDKTLKYASVEVLVLIKDGDQIIKFDKSRLNGPAGQEKLDFSDVKRIALDPGTYTLEVEITDLNDKENKTVLAEQLVVIFEGPVQQSQIQLLASFEESTEKNALVKNGFAMKPIPFHFYNRKYQSLAFYAEVYHEDKDEENYIISYSISKLLNNGQREEKIKQFKRRKVKSTDPILVQLDLSRIESGDYVLNLSVVDKQQQIISEAETFFIRANPEFDYLKAMEYSKPPEEEKDFTQKLDSMTLRYSLRALVPVIPQSDAEVLKIILARGDLKAMRMFLYNHFEAQFIENPEFAFKKFMDVAKAVDKKYENGFGFGFEADRGFYFLKYGKPDDIREVFDEPSAPPYEIWFYNTLVSTGQNNVRFVFYNPSLVENGHILLHSTARGEWNNPKWEVMLYSNSNSQIQGGNPVDGNRTQDNFGKQARRLYDDF